MIANLCMLFYKCYWWLCWRGVRMRRVMAEAVFVFIRLYSPSVFSGFTKEAR